MTDLQKRMLIDLFGLWAAACKSLSYLTNGIEMADSWSVDAHKTLWATTEQDLFKSVESFKQAILNLH